MPFSLHQFLQVFADYNQAVWPMQGVWVTLALALIVAAFLPNRIRPATITIGLSLLWTWMGAVYHLLFFRRINPAALGFGIAFLAQAVALATWGVRTSGLSFRPRHDRRTWAGAMLQCYALVIYPKLSVAFGHPYPTQPTFGLPCPTTIATIGLLLWASPQPPWWVWLVPLVWSVIGSAAAFRLGMREDLGLLVGGILALLFLWSGRPGRQGSAGAGAAG